jgi:type IV pilus assembly protein PilV
MTRRASHYPAAVCPRSAPRDSSGFSLLEVLVALLVLSIGLLGLAGLQAHTVSFNHSAYMRSQATSLAYDMSDRMRANRQAARDGEYDLAFADPAPSCGVLGGNTVAERDIAAWGSALACELPAGNGRIERNGERFTITVSWNEARSLESDDTEEFQMVTGL